MASGAPAPFRRRARGFGAPARLALTCRNWVECVTGRDNYNIRGQLQRQESPLAVRSSTVSIIISGSPIETRPEDQSPTPNIGPNTTSANGSCVRLMRPRPAHSRLTVKGSPRRLVQDRLRNPPTPGAWYSSRFTLLIARSHRHPVTTRPSTFPTARKSPSRQRAKRPQWPFLRITGLCANPTHLSRAEFTIRCIPTSPRSRSRPGCRGVARRTAFLASLILESIPLAARETPCEPRNRMGLVPIRRSRLRPGHSHAVATRQ